MAWRNICILSFILPASTICMLTLCNFLSRPMEQALTAMLTWSLAPISPQPRSARGCSLWICRYSDTAPIVISEYISGLQSSIGKSGNFFRVLLTYEKKERKTTEEKNKNCNKLNVLLSWALIGFWLAIKTTPALPGTYTTIPFPTATTELSILFSGAW